MDPIQMLWIGPRLSAMERLSIASFLANGHAVNLYTYDEVEGIPEGAVNLYAGDIVRASKVFSQDAGFERGSYAAFSDLFRYQLLLARGGIWCESDVVCLRPFEFDARDYVVASERLEAGGRSDGPGTRLHGCVMKAPAGSEVLAECREICEAVDINSVGYGDLGPELLTRVFGDHGLSDRALAPEAFCPVAEHDARRLASKPLAGDPAGYAVHLWNAQWLRHGLDKDARFPDGCAYESLRRRYIAHR